VKRTDKKLLFWYQIKHK